MIAAWLPGGDKILEAEYSAAAQGLHTKKFKGISRDMRSTPYCATLLFRQSTALSVTIFNNFLLLEKLRPLYLGTLQDNRMPLNLVNLKQAQSTGCGVDDHALA